MKTQFPILRIEMFGGVRIKRLFENNVEEIKPPPQLKELLAYLAYSIDSGVSREEIQELFWPHSDPIVASHKLSNALSSTLR